MSSELTYKKSGVDIYEGDRFVSLISPMAKRTFRPEVMTEIGFFSALFKLDLTRYKEPVLVSGTDGVGTKLKIAFMMDRHDIIGIDLVAMCVNDILTAGAEPLFFLDYLATGKLHAEKALKVIEGIVKGCKEAGCSLIGGETAEMPGFYPEGEYDVAGFSVGIVEKEKIINGSSIREGDVIIGLASNGLHSNGYSLVRRLFFNLKKMGVDTYIPDLGTTLGEELLRPTRIYVKAFMTLRDNFEIKGMAHITGGGIPGNLPRILPEGTGANIRIGSWPVPPIFDLIKKIGNIADEEMKRTFNMGIGYIMVASEEVSERVVSLLNAAGYKVFIIGNIEKGGKGVRYS
ncbi:MAG: phosphoribosylformylglycinamidine cyclo-ligase [Thermodesulfovibrionales bacterium]|nr:phosphoribosylformylglycinamidine cyclo-ligase [Thermodesulfovibrionales bacterium]